MSRSFSQLVKSELQLRLIEESIPRIIQCLHTLSEQEVWFAFNKNSNSVGNLILHLDGNIRQYLIASIGGQADHRNRDLEFSTKGISRANLESILNLLMDDISSTITNITEEELLRIRHVQGFKMTGFRAAIHAIEHFSYHTGQIALITKALKDIDLQFYGDLDLNITGE